MLVAMNSPTDYKQIMELCVCNLENHDCMLQHCDDYPDSLVLKEFFVKELLKTFEHDDTIRFNQWISTDRTHLVEQESTFDHFVDDLAEKFLELTEHHYIAKQQSQLFKETKTNLNWGVHYCSYDYSFLVQNAVQGFHHATIRLAVIYYANGPGDILHKSYACLSEHNTHRLSLYP